MAKAEDVAAYILEKRGEMTTWKLQKLLYYSQAWHLVWDEEPLFLERIEAWANGPVVKDIYNLHRGQFTVTPGSWNHGDPSKLTESEAETLNIVLSSYGSLSGRQLSHLTHSELPWQKTREGLAPTVSTSRPIELDLMAEFYGALDADENASSVTDIDWPS